MDILPGASPLTGNERELIGILYSCPLGEPASNCVLYQIRNEIKSDYQNAIDSFEKEKIPEILSEHKKCLVKRFRNNDIEQTIKNYHKLHNEIAYLHWTKKCNIGILTSELKKREWIKSQSEFSELFENTEIKRKIYWNMKFKYELALLLFKLKESHFFHPMNTKGYFIFAENHILSYSENKLPKNTLKYMCYKILNKPEKYFYTIMEVDEIMNELTLCSK